MREIISSDLGSLVMHHFLSHWLNSFFTTGSRLDFVIEFGRQQPRYQIDNDRGLFGILIILLDGRCQRTCNSTPFLYGTKLLDGEYDVGLSSPHLTLAGSQTVSSRDPSCIILQGRPQFRRINSVRQILLHLSLSFAYTALDLIAPSALITSKDM